MSRPVCSFACLYLLSGCFAPNLNAATLGTDSEGAEAGSSGAGETLDPGATTGPQPSSSSSTAPTGQVDDDTGSDSGGASTSRGPTGTDASSTGSTAATDTGTGSTDETSGAENTGTEPDDSVYDVRQGEVPLDSQVEIRDVIVTGVGANGFFVQEPMSGMYSGIWVFTGVAGPAAPALGDVVDIEGVYEEFFDLSEINVSDGTLTVTASPGAGNVPSAQVLTPGELDEPWEGVFVRVQNDTFEVAEIGSGAQNDFRVTDTSGASVWVDDDIYDAEASGDFPGFSIGSTFVAIQGPVNFAFSEFRVVPRGMADLSGFAQ